MMEVRKAKKNDCEMFYIWANDDEVRKNAFNTNKIPYENHIKWFEEKINNTSTYMYICIDDKKNVGQFRIEKEDNKGIINYSVDKNYRKMGYGKKILETIIKCFERDVFDIDILIGKVKFDNKASQKCFIKTGFKKENTKEEYMLYKYKKQGVAKK